MSGCGTLVRSLSRTSANDFEKDKNNACIFCHDVLIYFGSQNASIFPGVAKFGIALEWGSRGLEFESRHSDQDKLTGFDKKLVNFSFYEIEIRKIKRNTDERCWRQLDGATQ